MSKRWLQLHPRKSIAKIWLCQREQHSILSPQARILSLLSRLPSKQSNRNVRDETKRNVLPAKLHLILNFKKYYALELVDWLFFFYFENMTHVPPTFSTDFLVLYFHSSLLNVIFFLFRPSANKCLISHLL